MKLFKSFAGSFAGILKVPNWEKKIEDVPEPDYVVIPLEYPGQIRYKPQVKIGEQVFKNQVIGKSLLGNCVHAVAAGGG